MEPLRADAGELEADEILTALVDGRRIVIVTEMLGSEHEVTLRHDGSTFYCDTPTTLHKHGTEDEMRECIHNQGYARDTGSVEEDAA
jgi:hemin uptake protein HemP